MFFRRIGAFVHSPGRLTKGRRRKISSRGTTSGNRTTIRLGVEQLEDRRMLSVDPLVFPNFDTTEALPPAGFQFSDGNRWSETATDGSGLGQGDATTLTWSIVPDGTQIPASSFDDNGGGAGPSDLVSFLDGIRGNGGGGADLTIRPWFQVFTDAFDRLSELSGLTYVYEASDDGVALNSADGSLGVRGDVRISGRFIDGQPSGGSTLAFNAFPDDSDMVIDTGNISFYSGTANNSLSFRNTLMHEAGHGIGLNHVHPIDQTKLMEPTITTNFDGPQYDDILAMQRGYGDVLEKNGGNDSTGTATPLGLLSPGSMQVFGADGGPDAVIYSTDVDFLSIDDDSDQDLFGFQLLAGAAIKVQLTPLGPTYDQGPQPDDGDPEVLTSFDGTSQNDLALEILNGAGVVVASADANGAGQGELISNFDASAGGQFFARVSGADNAAQLYQLQMIVSDRFEANDSIEEATVLGSEPSITLRDLSIHNGDDEDFFKITAHDTGKLIVNAYFEDAVGDIDIQIQDSLGNVIDSSISTTDDEQIIIPVVGQEMYFLRVFGAGVDTMNTYELELENFAAPAPSYVDLTPSSDTGMMNDDNVTADTTPTFLIQADLTDFRNMGVTLLDRTSIDPNNDGDAEDASADGAGVFVTLVNLSTGVTTDGFANQVGPSGYLWTFTPSSPLTAGDYFVSSAVTIVDGQQDPDRENGRAQLSDPLFISIVTADPGVADLVSADLLDASDSGMFNDDNVTKIIAPAFQGIAPVGSKVRLFANGELVGSTVAGTDASDVNAGPIGGIGGAADDGLGLWEITSEPLSDNGYDITLEIEDGAGNITVVDPTFNDGTPIDVVVDTEAPNTPLLDLLDDTGRHDVDNITRDNQPQVFMTSTDPNIQLAQLLYTDNLKFRIFDRFESTAETLIYNSAVDATADNATTPADMFTSLTSLTRTLPDLVASLDDGVHNLKLEVEDRAGNISHDFLLEIVVDTAVPPVSFGLPDAASEIDGLAPDNDSGVTTVPATFADRITNDATPRLWGRAEADSIVQVYLDRDGDGEIDLLTDTFLGQAVATPFDGNDAYLDGYWELTTIVDLNEIVGLPKDGLRSLLVTAEDVAGNPAPIADTITEGVDQLDIFIDTQGPQVDAVFVPDFPDYDLFDPKPSVNGPTPLINSLQIDLVDFVNRQELDFLYDAIDAGLAVNPGKFRVVGDHVGIVPIENVAVAIDPAVTGEGATANITLTFFQPLPDDRFTLTILDTIADPAGNLLDGESNAAEPQEDPTFPSGDGIPGGDFAARFTVDSRPEIGAYVAQNINLDINGNFVWDPANGQIGNDATNVDLTFTMNVADPANGAVAPGGYSVHDLVFAGKFAPLNQLIVGDDAVFVIDVSGSTSGDFGGDPVGDQNADGSANTILDAEIAAFKLLNQQLIDRGLGNTSQVSIVSFDSSATSLDMDPLAAGIQLTTTPLADVNANGMRDVDEVLMSLASGGGTDFEVALAEAIATMDAAGFGPGDANVIFLSDGFGGGAFSDEVVAIRDTRMMNLRAFGVGPGASLAQLLTIDPDAASFSNTNELLGAFGGGGGGGAIGNLSGFDQLAVYGFSSELGGDRWLIDTNSDGVVNTGEGDILTLQPLIDGFDVVGAIPVAGNFDGNLANGDEIGLYNAGQWALDTNHNFVIDAADLFIVGNLFGHPVVGDFDGNGDDDLGVFNNNTWSFDLNAAGFDGNADDTLIWGYPGVLDRPVATDMDQDGIDDIGLWVPRNSAQAVRPVSEWYFLTSDDADEEKRIAGQINTLDHPFEPVPFGKDIYAEFGDELALPIVGNFDPPVVASSQPPVIDPQNNQETGDFNQDGQTDGADFLSWQIGVSSDAPPTTGNGDGNHDNLINGDDLAMWADHFGDNETNVTTLAALSGLDGDGTVGGDGLDAWESQYGQANVNGGAFLAWQREQSSSSQPTLAAASSSSESQPVFDSEVRVLNSQFSNASFLGFAGIANRLTSENIQSSHDRALELTTFNEPSVIENIRPQREIASVRDQAFVDYASHSERRANALVPSGTEIGEIEEELIGPLLV